MTHEQQRIAIAQSCGLNVKPKTVCPYCKGNTPYEAGDVLWGTGYYGITLWAECETCNNTGKVEPYCTSIPDYLNDLNAMHEAEKVLTDDDENERYCQALHDVCGADQFPSRVVIFATAAQRAEAFLRTLNLWVD